MLILLLDVRKLSFSDNTGNLIDYPKINDNYTITSDFVNNTLFFKIEFSLDNNENFLSNYPNDAEYLFPLVLYMNFADYLGSYNLFLDNIAGLKLHINKFKLESHNLPNQKIKLPNKLLGTETLSIKILKNLKTDITNRFNKIEQLNIKCNDNNSINGFSYHNVLAVSYLDGLSIISLMTIC